MHVSRESNAQTKARLERVIKKSRLKVYEKPYCFAESDVEDTSLATQKGALAIVRDDRVWSQLVPATGDEKEVFKIFRFHFPEGEDNSGFVGWLASVLKHKTGSGVFVICGQNSMDGGIYDYYGCPTEVASEVEDCIRSLKGEDL